MSTAPPPPLVTGPQDTPLQTWELVQNDVVRFESEDYAIHHTPAHLPGMYPPQLLQAYGLVCWTHEDTAHLLAAELVPTPPPTRYVDLGCGTGFTAAAVVAAACPGASSVQVTLVDGMTSMLTASFNRVRAQCSDPHLPDLAIRTLVDDLASDLGAVRAVVEPASIVSAQRVLLNVCPDRRAQQLGVWKALLAPEGRMVVDIPHPKRITGSLELRTRAVDSVTQRWTGTQVMRLVGNDVLSETQQYARELATQAGMVVVNAMPWHMPPAAVDATAAVDSWMASVRSPSMIGPLSAVDRRWYARRYAGEAVEWYRRREWVCSPDVAAVVAVLQRAPSLPSSLPPSLSRAPPGHDSTKYAMDEGLTGKARRQAIKKAAKEAKKSRKAAEGTVIEAIDERQESAA